MTKPDLPTFATDANYTNGPDTGTSTKVKPSASALAEGFINGLANSPDAQSLNWWMNTVYEWVARLSLEAADLAFLPYKIESPFGEYSGESFDHSTELIDEQGLHFSTDGTKMFIGGAPSASAIYQYTLATPWDITSASYDSVSLDVSSQDTNLRGFVFSTDGTKLFLVGSSTDAIYQYNLGTAWNISTASYSSSSLSVSSQDTSPSGITASSDGTKLYVCGSATSTEGVYQYTLSTPWDLSTASYSSKSISVTSQDTEPSDVVFSADGKLMFVSGETSEAILQYSLSTAWDVSTASYDSVSMSTLPSVLGADPKAVRFSADGTKMYILIGAGNSVFMFYTTRAVKAY